MMWWLKAMTTIPCKTEEAFEAAGCPRPNCCIIYSEADKQMFLVPTGNSEEAFEMMDEYAPQDRASISGGMSVTPIWHPHPEHREVRRQSKQLTWYSYPEEEK